MPPPIAARQRWTAFSVVCIGTLMIVLDTTIVNVALPSIRAALGFSETSLVWVVNAYMLTFGGFLLLGGRLGDLYGQRRLFVAGIVVFTLASLVCGLATTQVVLVVARAVQGLGGAVADAIALSLVVNLFEAPPARAKAMGIFGLVCAAGGSVGVLLGGLLTHALNWHWIFFVNIPIGIVVTILSFAILPPLRATQPGAGLDVGGAIAVTLALMLAVYAVVDGDRAGWLSTQTIALAVASLGLFALFLAIESRVAQPLMPLGLLRIRQVAAANVIGVLWAAGMFAWFFISALYLQRVLGYDAREVGLAFLPSNLIMAILSVGVSARLVNRYGFRGPLAFGLAAATLGLALFARAPVDGHFVIDVLPGMTLLGIGAGMAFNPLILAAMSDVRASDSGVASGIVNTAFMLGGSLGLAVLASIAAARSGTIAAGGAATVAALNAGYHAAFAVGALFAGFAATLAWFAIRRPTAAASSAEP